LQTPDDPTLIRRSSGATSR